MCFHTSIKNISLSGYRSHFGSRYKLGCCGHAGLISFMGRTWFTAAVRELARSNHYISYSQCSLRPMLPIVRPTLDIPGFLQLLWRCWRQQKKPTQFMQQPAARRAGEQLGQARRSHINTLACLLSRSQATRYAGSHYSCCQIVYHISSPRVWHLYRGFKSMQSKLQWSSGIWCSGITSASHGEGPG